MPFVIMNGLASGNLCRCSHLTTKKYCRQVWTVTLVAAYFWRQRRIFSFISLIANGHLKLKRTNNGRHIIVTFYTFTSSGTTRRSWWRRTSGHGAEGTTPRHDTPPRAGTEAAPRHPDTSPARSATSPSPCGRSAAWRAATTADLTPMK